MSAWVGGGGEFLEREKCVRGLLSLSLFGPFRRRKRTVWRVGCLDGFVHKKVCDYARVWIKMKLAVLYWPSEKLRV